MTLCIPSCIAKCTASPLTNQASHLKRLASIRKRLGWEEAGLPADGEALGRYAYSYSKQARVWHV